ALSRSARTGTLMTEPSARDRETPEHGVERLACMLHALRGTGELEEDRALGSLHDRAEELVPGLLHHGSPEAAAPVRPLPFHQVHLEAADLLHRGLRLDRLAVLATELLGPAPDVGLDAAALTGAEIEDRELRRIGIPLGLRKRVGRRAHPPVRLALEGVRGGTGDPTRRPRGEGGGGEEQEAEEQGSHGWVA